MTVARVNALNLGLILLALAVALVVPFELFLLAYAILGPLHYLTEISWLHDRNYFASRSSDWIPLWILGLAGAVFVPGVFGPEPVVLQIPWAGKLLASWQFDMAFLGFGVALILVLTRNLLVRLVSVLILLQVLRLFRTDANFITAFAVYLPSLVHVFVFTGLFMLWGALKGKSLSGYFTFAVFLAAGAAACFAPGVEKIVPSSWAITNFVDAFKSLTYTVLTTFGGMHGEQAYRIDLFTHPKAIAAVRFLGFAYTYHYLNWFSKTTVIKWHLISKTRFAVILVLWAASITLYLVDYGLGLSWLFILSFAHVVLEFPLNHRSFHGIVSELRVRVLPARATQ